MTDNILKIACAGLGIAQIELAERIDNSVLHHIVQRADFTITIANTFLVWGALFIAFITIGITIYFNREKKKDIENAISEVLQKLSNDDKIKRALIERILANDSFKQELKAAIDIAARDQIDLDKESISVQGENLKTMGG